MKINSASVLTRYPEDLEKIKKLYTKDVVKDILDKNKEVIAWIKNQF
ncbi:MAG: HEPN domain-containing protein [Candidatus Aminicenantes bacterium]|nr:HEPN domain-containing protein [Candidatus Aminicenantes bacterium]